MSSINNDKYKISIIGNKCDLEEKRVVTREMGEKLAKKYDANFHEISVKEKNNEKLGEIFEHLTKNIIDDIQSNKITKEEIKKSNNIRISNEKIYNNEIDFNNKCCNIL